MGFGARHQRCQSGDEVLRLTQYMGGAIAKRSLQLKHHQSVTVNTQALLCDGTARPICPFSWTAQPLKFGTFMRFTRDGAVEREPIDSGGQWLSSSAARPNRQQRVVQAHRGATGLRAGGDDIPYCCAGQLLVGRSSGTTLDDLDVCDFLVAGYAGDTLVLRAGMASSGWSGFEITFSDVSYMALPTMIDQADLRHGGEDARERATQYFDAMDEDSRVYELVEQAWIDSSGEALPAVHHLIVAGDVQIKRLPNPNENK
jgi:hypothetical protein